MFDASLQETLARYSDPSQNPYVQVRSQTPEPLHHPGLDVFLDTPSASQWKPRWKLDVKVFEQFPQVLDSRGCYIQSPTLRTHPQSCVQQVLPEHANFVKSSCYTDENLGAMPAPKHDAATVDHKRSGPDVPQILSSRSCVLRKFWFKHSSSGATNDETMSVLAPANLDEQPSASGTHVDPIVTADESDASFMFDSDVSRSAMIDATAEEEETAIDEGKADSRREAGNREVENSEMEGMEIQNMELPTKEAETRKIERIEIEKSEIERQESVAKTLKKEPRVSPATNTSKLLRIERKLNNKDLFMGWYKSTDSSELRYPRECIAPKTGDVYVHSCKKEGNPKFQLWVRQISRGMTIWVKAHIFHIHPKLLDRRLTLATTGEPYWSTRQSLLASGSRERASKMADMILY
ncbi:uncharacterized protein EDB93DRAFT_1252284 [Suillus bovinus]|uniref:uncharacterized protein n=1 Tax=Suillus bovinus TaxID=48563 RepID=UPI001B879006|nr:uncharacterized protein EDB93DRAFT_1252284 [Suillus bovinus]KAG2142223.1 hypothetical protein EDB93DRAFT_1252284 [Suillus bovinus]